MSNQLSAAEIKTLRSPEIEQVKTMLPLLLKELVLCGWVNVCKGKRPTNYTLWGLLAVLSIGLFAVNIAFGFFAIVVLSIAFFVTTQPKMLLSLTPLGEQKLKYFGPSSPLLVRILHSVAFARPQDEDNCTDKEWRKHLGKEYPNNAAFHKDCLLFSLKHKGLVKIKDRFTPVRTPAGDAVLAKAEAEIELGHELPRLLREGAPQAAVLAASLGGMLLLVPDMEGYYHTLMENVGFPEMDLDEPQRKANSDIYVSSSSDASFDHTHQEHHEEAGSDNGMDWGDNADFLDGDSGIGSDSGIGADSGCGVGSDSSDSGGGDGGGDGGGCGGCGGGGD